MSLVWRSDWLVLNFSNGAVKIIPDVNVIFFPVLKCIILQCLLQCIILQCISSWNKILRYVAYHQLGFLPVVDQVWPPQTAHWLRLMMDRSYNSPVNAWTCKHKQGSLGGLIHKCFLNGWHVLCIFYINWGRHIHVLISTTDIPNALSSTCSHLYILFYYVNTLQIYSIIKT